MLIRVRIKQRTSLKIKLYLAALIASIITIPIVINLFIPKTQEFTNVFKKKACFPIPKGWAYSFTNDFGTPRLTSTSKRSHEGNDIMAKRNTPIVAMEDCKIEIIGWNQLGGNRINMISLDGNRRYYFAHLESYQAGLRKESNVKQGEIVGYVGSSGYGPPDSDTGAPPHLHIQIWVKCCSLSSGCKEQLINPYSILKLLEGNKINCLN